MCFHKHWTGWERFDKPEKEGYWQWRICLRCSKRVERRKWFRK